MPMARFRLLSASVSGTQPPIKSSKSSKSQLARPQLRKRRAAHRPRPQRQAVAARGLQRLDHVKIVRPGLGEVFIGVHRGVLTDEALRPIHRRALLVVAVERLLVIRALVAKELAKALDARRFVDQPKLEVVADLVAEVTQHGAIGPRPSAGASSRGTGRRPPRC